ncbi:YcnI family copper-binding membrane protein [Gordonia asplenii]|nr:YcnI family protein [Gordonia asplenii]
MLPKIVAPIAVVAAASFMGAGVAAAHVTVSSTTATQGGYGLVSLVVPNESDTNATTTSVSIQVPRLKSVRTESMPGWRAVIEKDPKTLEALRVTWTAADGNTGLKVGEFGQFTISAGPFPQQETVDLPAVQTYSDGTVVNWNQPDGPNGAEPEHPTPTLKLAKGTGGDDDHPASTNGNDEASASSADDTARILGGVALVVAAVGVVVGGLGLVRRRKVAGSDVETTDEKNKKKGADE